MALLRVVRVRPHRLGESPILEELDFDGAEVPARDALERLADTRTFAFVNQRIDWQQAGFQKVQTIAGRPGDDQAPLPHSGSSWASLADRYRSRAAQ